MLAAGTRAPGFSLPNEQGLQTSLSQLLEDGPLILYFYPADFTPFCTREACSLRDMHADILSAGIRVAGISPQSVASHIRFKERYRSLDALLIDDVMATGGTAAATIRLVEKLGGNIVGLGFVIELAFLGGRAKLAGHEAVSLLTYE